jgi:hypothetical protein
MAIGPREDDETVLVLLERGADVHARREDQDDVLYRAIYYDNVPMACVLLNCGADAKIIKIDQFVTQAQVDAAIAEYENTHAFIEKYHELLEYTLSTLVEVDTRMYLRSTGIYQEPMIYCNEKT